MYIHLSTWTECYDINSCSKIINKLIRTYSIQQICNIIKTDNSPEKKNRISLRLLILYYSVLHTFISNIDDRVFIFVHNRIYCKRTPVHDLVYAKNERQLFSGITFATARVRQTESSFVYVVAHPEELCRKNFYSTPNNSLLNDHQTSIEF